MVMQLPTIDRSASDDGLLASLSRGDEQTLAELMRRHEASLRGAVFCVLGTCDDLDDVLQHVWSAVWRKRREMPGIRKFRTWLYCIARRAAVDARRQRTRRMRLRRELADRQRHLARPGPGVGQGAEQQYERTLRALGELPEKYRSVLVLKVWHEMSYRDIAETLNLPVKTVETRLLRAHKRLRAKLRREEE